MYKVVPSSEGFQVFWKSSHIERPIDGARTYVHRQAAYRKAKHLNDQNIGECFQCGEPADWNCQVGSCAPGTLWCWYHYEQAHLPEDERD